MSFASKGLAIVLGVVVILGSGVFGSRAVGETLSTTLFLDSSSEFFFDVTVDTDIGSDSDSDSSTLNGFLDLDLEVDFSSGQMVVSDFTITGGFIELDNTLNLHFSYLLGLVTIDVDSDILSGFPSTPLPPSVLSPNATDATDGLFDAGDHLITIDSGTLTVTGAVSDSIDLSTNPISGASESATAGRIELTKGDVDVVENTTFYEVDFFLPIEFNSVTTPPEATITSVVTGQIDAVAFDLVIDFVETNGVVGDVNQNGVLFGDGTGDPQDDDVSAFVEGWLSTGLTPGLAGYKKGDLNFDTETNLADAYILHQALLAAGAGSFDFGLLNAAPEPSGALLLMIGGLLLGGRRFRFKV